MNCRKAGLFGIMIMTVMLLDVWAATTDWKKIGESDGIAGYTRTMSDSPFEEVKGVGMVEAPVAAVEALLRDRPAFKEFMYKVKESDFINAPEFKNTADTTYGYSVTGMTYPVKDRDVVTRADFTIDKATGTVYVHVEGIKTTYKMDSGRVRMPMMVADYTLAPKGPNRTQVTYIGKADPGGSLPSFVVNMFTKNVSIKLIAGIREMMNKDKYRSIKTVVTTTPRNEGGSHD